MRRTLVVTAAVLAAASCEQTADVADGITGPSWEILDGAHQGNEHFYFLPPMVPSPSTSGTFDGSQSPRVEICALDGGVCQLPALVAFTMTTGPGSETVRVAPEDEHYVVKWHTDEFGLDATSTYRIHVLVDDVELGHADVDVVNSGKELKNVNTGEYVALKDGRTLPIKFRIEEGALAPADPPTTVFLNFDGVMLTRSPTSDDATTNTSALVAPPSKQVSAFNPAELSDDGGLTRSQIIAATVAQLAAIHAPYHVVFTTTRPTSGDYQMVVFGGSCLAVIGTFGCEGIALSDCGNVMPSNISFVFPAGLRVEDLAVVAARENAIALGLDPTDNPADIMFSLLQPTPPAAFAAGNTVGGGCTAPGTFQDSHQAMLDVLGAS